MVEVFAGLTHQCESCIEGNWAKPHFRKPMHNEVTGPWNYGGEPPLEVMEWQDNNGVDDSSIWPPVVELCWVESRMKMSFKDTWWLSIQERKNKWSSKIACRWIQQVCMGNSNMRTLPILAWWRLLQSWPTNARVALNEIKQNPSLRNRCTMNSLGHNNDMERAY